MHVAVLMGGFSSEREISLLSGDGVAKALEERGHRVTRIDVKNETVEELTSCRPDVAFIALHGRFGEDGGIQRRCEALGIPYTGSGPEASARALDKDEAKRAFVAAGVLTPVWRVAHGPFDAAAVAREARTAGIRLPCVVKPVSEGSSIGVTIVKAEADFAPALEAVAKIGGPAMVEAFVAGREFTVGILGETTLPPIELVPKRAFYDFKAKYDASSGTEYDVDPALEPALRAKVLAAALGAHRSLGCAGCSRVDIRVDLDGHALVLEVNTIPGMTPRSLLPKAAAAVGIPYAALCERLLELGRQRQRVGETPGGGGDGSAIARRDAGVGAAA